VLDREFFLGFVKIHILYHASQEPIFGVWMSKELARHGYNLSPGVLYPTLRRLEKDGYLTQTSQVVDGKVRKYYTITDPGRELLRQASGKIGALVDEIMEPDAARPTRKGSQKKKKNEHTGI